jgi:hypothetical protein
MLVPPGKRAACRSGRGRVLSVEETMHLAVQIEVRDEGSESPRLLELGERGEQSVRAR